MGVLSRLALVCLAAAPGCTLVLSSTPCDTAAGPEDTADTADTGAPPRTASALAVGGHHTCAVDDDGSVSCWGFDGGLDVSTVPDALDPVADLTAGYLFTCARPEGPDTVPTCWGDDSEGQLSAPGAFSGPVAAGGAHTCGLQSSGVSCWGRDTEGQATPPSEVADATAVTLLASGWLFSCAQVTADSPGACWGHDDDGQVSTFPGVALTAMALGQGFGVGIPATGGAPVCWGRTAICDTLPTDDGTTWVDVQAGTDFACGLADTGGVQCWGLNDNGVLEDIPALSFQSISAGPGSRHVCGITGDATVVCWGLDASAQASP